MFARFDENPAMTLRVIKETKRSGRTDGRTDARTDGRTDGQRENSIPPTNKVCGGYKKSDNQISWCHYGYLYFSIKLEIILKRLKSQAVFFSAKKDFFLR